LFPAPTATLSLRSRFIPGPAIPLAGSAEAAAQLRDVTESAPLGIPIRLRSIVTINPLARAAIFWNNRFSAVPIGP
jgi:hypothetical protein